MVSVSAADVLGAKLESPLYAPVIECDPAASEEVTKVATPEAFSVLVPSTVEPSLNVTVPEGVPTLPAAFDTVAVNVTCCPVVAVLGAAVTAVVVSATVTISVTIAVEVLPRKLVSPEYFAVIEWVPTASDEVLNVACPFAPSVPVPICVVPSRKATLPVGIALAALDTVAVNVTCCPTVAVAAEDTTPVEVAACWIVSLSAVGDMLPVKFVSPEYFPVIEWIPADSDEVMNAACPFTFSAPVPICMLPSKNCTVPVGVPVVELETVAVNVTDCPKVAGFAEDMSAVELAACWMV